MPKSRSKPTASRDQALLPERYRSLVEDSADGFYCFAAASGRLLFINARAGELLGLDPVRARERRIWELIAVQERPAFMERLQTLRDGIALVPDRFTYTFGRRDAAPVRIEIGMHMTHFRGTAVIQGTLTDVTENELFQFNLQKARRLNTIALMADGIADRLENAVSVIRQNIEGIESAQSVSVELWKHIAQIKGAGRQIDRLTQKLLFFSRGGIYQPRQLNLNDAISGLVPLIRQLIKPSIRLKFAPAEGLPAVMADPGSLQTMLAAVITNADEAIADKGRITICTEIKETDNRWAVNHPDLKSGCYIGIAIQDNGAGMDPATLRRVGEPYFSTKFHGRGLGMAAVYGIIRRHSGWLNIDSKPRQGTCVTIYLPCAELRAQQQSDRMSQETALGAPESV